MEEQLFFFFYPFVLFYRMLLKKRSAQVPVPRIVTDFERSIIP